MVSKKIIRSNGPDIIRCSCCGKALHAERKYTRLNDAEYNAYKAFCDDCLAYTFAEVWTVDE